LITITNITATKYPPNNVSPFLY